MSDLTPADLAKFVHPVPVGATLPAGTQYVRRHDSASKPNTFVGPLSESIDLPLTAGDYAWTAEPIPAPMPQLPTERGSIIVNVRRASLTTCPVMIRGIDSWVGVDEEGYFWDWPDDEITAWTPARIVTD